MALGYGGGGARVDGLNLLVELHHLSDASLALLELVLHGLLLRLYVTHVLASRESVMMGISYHRFGDGVNLRVCNPMRGWRWDSRLRGNDGRGVGMTWVRGEMMGVRGNDVMGCGIPAYAGMTWGRGNDVGARGNDGGGGGMT